MLVFTLISDSFMLHIPTSGAEGGLGETGNILVRGLLWKLHAWRCLHNAYQLMKPLETWEKDPRLSLWEEMATSTTTYNKDEHLPRCHQESLNPGTCFQCAIVWVLAFMSEVHGERLRSSLWVLGRIQEDLTRLFGLRPHEWIDQFVQLMISKS